LLLLLEFFASENAWKVVGGRVYNGRHEQQKHT